MIVDVKITSKLEHLRINFLCRHTYPTHDIYDKERKYAQYKEYPLWFTVMINTHRDIKNNISFEEFLQFYRDNQHLFVCNT